MAFNTVFFDIGGVLFRFEPARRLKLMSEASGINIEKLQVELWDSGFSDACDRGEFDSEQMYDSARDLLDWDPGIAEFRRLWASAFELETGVFEIALSLRGGIKKGILSNNPQILREAIKENYPQVEETFAPIVFSHAHRSCKPNSALFETALSEAGCIAAEAVLVDDSDAYVTVAKEIGMNAIRFDSVEQLRCNLSQIGLLQ